MLLNAMRNSASHPIAKVLFSFLLLGAVLGLGMMDYNGMFRAGFHRDSVATVAGTEITGQALDSEVRQILSRQSLDPKTAYRMGYINQILNAEIVNRLLGKAGTDLGVQVGDDVVAKQVQTLVAPFASKDISPREALHRILQNQGMSEQQFTSELRTETANNIVRNAIQGGASFVPDQEALDLYRFQHEQRTLKILLLPNSAMKDYKEPTDAVLKPFYDVGQERFAIPETRSLSMLILSPETAKKTAEITDADLKKAYQDDPAAYSAPEQRVMQQAILKDQAQAQAVADKVKAGSGLKTAAQTIAKSSDAYVGEEAFQKSGLAPEIAGPAFAAQKGDLIGPVQTALGWHVLVVKDILPPATKPFESVKDQLRQDLLKSRSADALYTLSGKIDDQLASGSALEEVAKDNGLTIKKYGPLRLDGSTPDGKDAFKDYQQDHDTLLKTAFGLHEGETSSVQELKGGGGYIVLRADHVTPKSYKPFEQVKPDLRKIWIEDQQDVLNKEKANSLLKALDSHQKTLDQLAVDNRLKTKTLTLSRGDTAPYPLTATAKGEFFKIGPGAFAAASADHAYLLAQVEAVQLPDTAKISDDDLKQLKTADSRSLQDAFLGAYLNYLRDKYGVKVNNAQLETMYGAPAKDASTDE